MVAWLTPYWAKVDKCEESSLIVTLALILALSCLVVFLAVAVVTLAHSPLRSRVRSRVLVTLKSGATFDGVLYSADRRVWVLRSASALGAGDKGAPLPVDGEVLILAADIEFAQKP